MKVISDNTFLKFWIDGQSPILFIQLKREFLTLSNAMEVYTMANLKSIKLMASAHSDLYLLLDFSDTTCNEVESYIQYFEHTFTRRIKTPFRYIGIVKSKNLADLHLRGKNGTPVGIFNSFFEALGSINNMRTKEFALY